MANAVTLSMVKEAYETLRGVVRHTDLLPASASVFGEGNEIYIKAENLQRTGSFKVRGAYCRMAKLSEEEKKKGVICASAGNHAQGVALAAKTLGIAATVVMPEGAPLSKLAATRAYGAEVVLGGAGFDQALEKARQIQQARGLTFIHAFDDPLIIAGQGTIALEILKDLPECETIVVPIGGGGLAGGVALAAKALNPRVRVIGVEPENAASMHASLLAGHISPLEVSTLADGVAVGRVGELTYDLCRKYLDDIVTVSEGEIASTILSLLERMKIVAEGAGAVSLAAVINGRAGKARGGTVAILSGGNIDVNMLERIIDKGLVNSGRRTSFATVIGDKPGQLSKLLDLVASLGANILSVSHNRMARDAALGQVVVSLELETRDSTHIHSLLSLLGQNGYKIQG